LGWRPGFMTVVGLTESVVEQAALAWLESLGWRVTHGLEIASGETGAERVDYA
jgi:type I restriction enzyme R subunit